MLWALVWSLFVSVAETPLISRVDLPEWARVTSWLLLQWSQGWWWLLGCALLWTAQRAERSAGALGLVMALLAVGLLNAAFQPILTWSLRPLYSAILGNDRQTLTVLLPSLDLDSWASLALYQLWVILSYGGLLVLCYTLVARLERTQQLLHRSALARGQAETLLSVERLRTQQSQIDPLLLLTTMGDLEQRYRDDPRRGDRLLASLVDFLRSAMPGLRERHSTLHRELDLARAYLALQAERGASAGFLIEEAVPSDHLAIAFPSLLILPLLALADTGETTHIGVSQSGAELQVHIAGLLRPPDAELQDRIRRCLLAVHGPAFRLRVAACGPHRIEIALTTA